MTDLRSSIFIDRLQPQTMCYLGTWIRGALPRSDVSAQVIEVAPGLDIERISDIALKQGNVRAGILVVERQFGYLEFHGTTSSVQTAAQDVLERLGMDNAEPPVPQILASEVITRVDSQHSFLINRNRSGSMVLPGDSLYVLEMQPASFAIVAANEAEKAGRIKVIDYRMIGATGRVYLAGEESEIRIAAAAAQEALASTARTVSKW